MKKFNLLPVLILGLIFLTGCFANNSQNSSINTLTSSAPTSSSVSSTPIQSAAASPSSTPTPPATTIPTPEPISTPTPTPTPELTLVEVAKHATINNCWLAISGQVYDLSPYTQAGLHPGGDKILAGCGTEATTLFQSIEKHEDKAANMLSKYLLGALRK